MKGVISVLLCIIAAHQLSGCSTAVRASRFELAEHRSEAFVFGRLRVFLQLNNKEPVEVTGRARLTFSGGKNVNVETDGFFAAPLAPNGFATITKIGVGDLGDEYSIVGLILRTGPTGSAVYVGDVQVLIQRNTDLQGIPVENWDWLVMANGGSAALERWQQLYGQQGKVRFYQYPAQKPATPTAQGRRVIRNPASDALDADLGM